MRIQNHTTFTILLKNNEIYYILKKIHLQKYVSYKNVCNIPYDHELQIFFKILN